MSAYVVDKAHIDAMVQTAIDHRLRYWRPDPARPTGGDSIHVTRETADQVGQMLVDANVASVSYRYHGEAAETLPGRVDHWWTRPYTLGRHRGVVMAPVAGLKACDGYEYQACEREDWLGSEAWRFVDALRGDLIGRLPGYAVAEWTLDDPAPAPSSTPIDPVSPGLSTLGDPAAEDDWASWRNAWLPGGE